MVFRKISLILCFLSFSLSLLISAPVEDGIILNNTNSLMSSFIPIRYGEEDLFEGLKRELTGKESLLDYYLVAVLLVLLPI